METELKSHRAFKKDVIVNYKEGAFLKDFIHTS